MRQYFEKMTEFGMALNKGQLLSSEENVKNIMEVEAGIDVEIEKVKNAGMPTEKINARGVMTVWQRLEYLIDPGTWNPLHT
ncbi:MAG: glutaconyl-CoA decarboxylase subunit alpha, partial [Desulfobacula sp.]|nr:glutaconyl-CoA decarboxylase subunit alpha [Desulfobacula sp.]